MFQLRVHQGTALHLDLPPAFHVQLEPTRRSQHPEHVWTARRTRPPSTRGQSQQDSVNMFVYLEVMVRVALSRVSYVPLVPTNHWVAAQAAYSVLEPKWQILLEPFLRISVLVGSTCSRDHTPCYCMSFGNTFKNNFIV